MNNQKEYALAYRYVKKTMERMLVDEERQSVSPQPANSDQVGPGLAISNSGSTFNFSWGNLITIMDDTFL